MDKSIFFTIFLFSLTAIHFQSYPQITEKNGILFRNHRLNPDTIQISSNTHPEKLLKSSSSEDMDNDPLELPFIKEDFIVNQFDGDYGADQWRGSSAIDGNGNYAFAWIDHREGEKNIYAQFFNSNDEKIGNNFKVNEDKLAGNNSPFIACNKQGDFVIVWLRNFSDVMAQRFTKDGQPIGGNILVNTIWGLNTMEPSVAVNNDGSFLIVWASEPGYGGYRVYSRLFNSSGNPVSSEIYISDQDFNTSSISQGKRLAIDNNGNYCITWSSYDNTSFSNIYLQKINGSGQKVGVNILINSPGDSSHNIFPEIVSTNDGRFFIAWEKRGPYYMNSGISARIYHSDNYFITDEIVISGLDSWGDVYNISSDKDSIFIIIYSGINPPYFQKINKSGEFVGDTVRVKYNNSTLSYTPVGILTDIINNKFYVTPSVYNRSDPDIYLQKFNIDMQPVGAFTKIHDDYGSANQRKSLVKFNTNGESIILWEDKRNGRYDLYAQVYDKDFNPVGNNIQVNETNAEYWTLYDKKIQCFSDGKFVIAFSTRKPFSDGSNIFLQLLNSSAEKIGTNKFVKEESYNSNIELNVNDNDEILICWYNLYGAYLRKYNKELSPISTESNFIKYTNPGNLYPFALSIDSAFNILTIWGEYNDKTYRYNLNGKFFDEAGKSVSEIFIIDSTVSNISNLRCINNNRDYAVLYSNYSQIFLKRKYYLDKEYSFNDRFYSYGYSQNQLNIVDFQNNKIFITYNSNMETFGFYANDNKRKNESFKLHTYDYINPYYYEYNGTNSTGIFDNKLIFTYESNKNVATGYDIWANVRSIDNVNFIKETFFEFADHDILYPNYPNPFNPKTKIAYQLLAYHKVKLSIYDILGRELKVLVDENQEKGIYEVEFNGVGLASGIYFYRLEAFNTTVKKMILLK